MKILYLQTFPLWGSGSGTYARYLASEMGKKHEVAMVAPDRRVPLLTRLYQVKLPFPVAFTGHPEWKKCRLYKDLNGEELGQVYSAFLQTSLRAVNEFRPEIIHVHHAYPLSWVAHYIRYTYGIHYLITIHGSELPTAALNWRYQVLTIDALKKAKKIIPNSYWTRDWFLEVFGDGQLRQMTRVIPGGVSLERFNPTLPTNMVERICRLKPAEPMVLFSGKLTSYKGVKYLIMAGRKIKAKIVILGDGPARPALEKQACDYGLTNIVFAGYLGKDTRLLNKFYNRADVFVAPSVWDEPLGLVVLEAMACQTPVVVTRKGGIPLAVKDGINGYFVRPRNASQIVEKVNKLLSDDALRRRMGERARAIVEKRFSWKVIGEKFDKLYFRYGRRSNRK